MSAIFEYPAQLCERKGSCNVHKVAVNVEGAADLLGSGIDIDARHADILEKCKVDIVGRGILFVLTHIRNQGRIIVASNLVSAIVFENICGETLQLVGRESENNMRKDELDHERSEEHTSELQSPR